MDTCEMSIFTYVIEKVKNSEDFKKVNFCTSNENWTTNTQKKGTNQYKRDYQLT